MKPMHFQGGQIRTSSNHRSQGQHFGKNKRKRKVTTNGVAVAQIISRSIVSNSNLVLFRPFIA
jgi:hypothetical protein